MISAIGQKRTWHAAVLMAAIVAGCATDGQGISGVDSASNALPLRNGGASLTSPAPIDLGGAGPALLDRLAAR